MAAGEELKEVDFKKVSLEDAFRILGCTPQGLTSARVAARLEQYGPNKLPDTRRNPVRVFLGYLSNPLAWAMEVAAIIAIALQNYIDFALIVALLLLNATISFVEERNADKAIKGLTSALSPKARVRRDGKWITIPAADLVPGDIIFVQFGHVIPADAKLLGLEGAEDQPLHVDQAALTGESLPVRKLTGDVVFCGSTVKQGERECLVYATGMNTFFGRGTLSVAGSNNVANLQKMMTRIGACCLITIAVWVLVELAVQFGPGTHFCGGGEDGCPTLSNILVIMVGGIPIAMPTILSVTLALGAYRLAQEGAVVARMSAVEEMAGMDILCSDKTGTLTLNQLTTEKKSVLCMGGRTLEEVMRVAALSANAASAEPIDLVLHNSYDDHATLWDGYTSTKFVPFNPVDKHTINHVRDKSEEDGPGFRIMKGAPQGVLSYAHNSADISATVTAKILEFAARGFRSLGVAMALDDGLPLRQTKWEFVGLIPLFDPPRHDTTETIRDCIELGISVKMVTGDQLLIAKETAKQLGMATNMYTADALIKAKEGKGALPDRAGSLREVVETADGFAEVFPEHKSEIVRILQSGNHLVGMTGDDVNDAPALKIANVGIAVDGATDAARGAADIVLTQPGLSVIVTAIIGARKIFQRMTTYSKYTVAMTFRICFTFGMLVVVYDWYFPTVLIVLLAVLNDVAMIALARDRVSASPVPTTWHLTSIFSVGIACGLYLMVSTWMLYYVASRTEFFRHVFRLFSLNTTEDVLVADCLELIASLRFRSAATACSVYKGQPSCATISVLDQCVAEQKWVRNSILRSLIYNQVSGSGQALVLVVRTPRWSFADLAGPFTYIAFCGAQIVSTLIAGLGFGGYQQPQGFSGGRFTQLSNGWRPLFLPDSTRVPRAGTESEFVASIIGCGPYVAVAWVWALIWHMPLDPIKWAAAWLLNEGGIRDRTAFHLQQQLARVEASMIKDVEHESSLIGAAASPTWTNPLGRASVHVPTQAQLEAASTARVLYTIPEDRAVP